VGDALALTFAIGNVEFLSRIRAREGGYVDDTVYL